ncbi:hypothetical protein Q8W17_05125 [Photobacterium damselae subsp. piscicida]|nr:hypothetical protein [Photobacterium damselae subsp. piscicida]
MGNFAAYASYKFNLVDVASGYTSADYIGDNTDDELMLGVRYSF